MAQVIDKYHAVARGSSTMYYYRYPDNTSEATRIYSGEGFFLHKDYMAKESNGMYLMIEPSGWIPFYYVDEVVPYYTTVTDACTPPSSVSVNTQTKVLTITGGAGGDLNNWIGFGVSRRDRTISSSVWGEWSADTVVSSRTVALSVASGMVCQYRVRTLGDAGSAYYSDYTVCDTLLNGNTAAGTPAVLLPVSGMETCSAAVIVKIDCPPEPDGDAMSLQRSMDGSAWSSVADLTAAGGIVYDTLSPADGSHSISYRLIDANGEAGGTDTITFTRYTAAWRRTISQGDIIANQEISFVADIKELLDHVNRLRSFYGKEPLVLPGTPGMLADWHKQMLAMQEAVDSCRTATNREAYGFELPTGWPKAYRINQLREAIENT